MKLNGNNATVTINDRPLNMDWKTATSDEIFTAVSHLFENLRNNTMSVVPDAYFIIPVRRWSKVKKGPNKGRVYSKRITVVLNQPWYMR